jgi:hypothetical protein
VFTIRATVTLPYPPGTVFDALASVEGTLRWQAGVRAVQRSGPRRTGARDGGPAALPACPLPQEIDLGDSTRERPLVLHYWALGARHRLRTRVVTRQPPWRFAYRAEGAAFVLDATFTVEPAPQGSRVVCRLTVHDGAELVPAPHGTPAGRLVAPGHDSGTVRLRRLLARRLPADLARLAELIAGHGGPDDEPPYRPDGRPEPGDASPPPGA